MAAAPTTWAVTALAHPGTLGVSEDCAECLALAETAITNATVTGSRGATYGTRTGDQPEHSATVARALAVLSR